ncbi:MAG TPA: hypothetical protein VFP37_18325, partial [Steroidobacteraceae bacterium]|nr:hypothetical protein [Steroidobacteraceae bacterium]
MRDILMALTAVLLVGCGVQSSGANPYGRNGREPEINPGLPSSISVTPEDLADGWTVSTPGAEGIREQDLQATLESMRAGNWTGVDSMVVVRHGKLVAEGYFGGYGRDTLHDLRSTGKSFTSAM